MSNTMKQINLNDLWGKFQKQVEMDFEDDYKWYWKGWKVPRDRPKGETRLLPLQTHIAFGTPNLTYLNFLILGRKQIENLYSTTHVPL